MRPAPGVICFTQAYIGKTQKFQVKSYNTGFLTVVPYKHTIANQGCVLHFSVWLLCEKAERWNGEANATWRKSPAGWWGWWYTNKEIKEASVYIWFQLLKVLDLTYQITLWALASQQTMTCDCQSHITTVIGQGTWADLCNFAWHWLMGKYCELLLLSSFSTSSTVLC